MARKFLYLVAILTVLVIAAMFALNIWSTELTRIAFVPKTAFVEEPALPANAYDDSGMWLSRPGAGTKDPAQWQPAYADGGKPRTSASTPPPGSPEPFAVFFVHPTSYMGTASWNAPLDDADSQDRARLFLRAMASPFADGGTIWAPRYRQAAFGAFLTDDPSAQQALNTAYDDVAQAFEKFLSETPSDTPIILAGHSQGALHLMRLMQDRVAGTPLAQRIAAAYIIGWPISLDHDLPQMGLPACDGPEQAGCIVSWSSYAEPAEPSMTFDAWRKEPGLDGKPHGNGPILCTNPLTGKRGGDAPAGLNLGTLVPDKDMKNGELVPAMVPARCDDRGLLLIGEPPDLGAYVLPGNNYHVYDIPLFWANLQADVARRVAGWNAVS
ncbi:hypothetical protein MB02_05970 [Croceicoccus estronivorus]|uniref:DUF3089 domain-containing protein n=1 Tax=Croceicoccus estronivorus TaxID=1172626 RepID=UPI00082F02D5|nr:DUF3089 domain-containing protein [Croceicoccus estronivorus]OCC24984.1 hypothetical protein MB02_05970 [Croceicoccus estronivorus]